MSLLLATKYAAYYISTSLILALALSSTLLGLESAWADSVIASIHVGAFPQNLAFNSDNGYMYVTNELSNTVSVIDGSTNTVIKTIDVGRNPFGVAFDAHNGYIYVTNLNSETVSVIDESTNTVIKTIPVDKIPFGIAFNSADHNMYVTNAGSDTVSIIDGSTNIVVESIPVGANANPSGIAFNPNNNNMYVANGGFGTVSVIATTTPIQTTISLATDGKGNPVQNRSSTSSNQITFQFTTTGGTPPITFECSLDNSPFSICASPQTYANLAVGQHTAQFRAIDSQQNITSVLFTWQVTNPSSLSTPPNSTNLNTETNQNTKCSTAGGDSTISESCNQQSTNNANTGVPKTM